MSRGWSALRPRVRVLVRRDEFVFLGRKEFTAAPILWFNEAGQVAAVGKEGGRPFKRLRRVDLVRQDQVLACEGEQGKAAELFLRYAITLVLLGDWRRSWIRPIVEYREDDRSLRDLRGARDERIEAFTVLARRAGALRLELSADAAV